ncbi:MAG: hypothetical protein V8R52_03440 [Coprobacter fastidiosus]
MNGLWDFQPVAVPRDWKQGNGVAPHIDRASEGQWEQVKIKIPSPWNVNDLGRWNEKKPRKGSEESLRLQIYVYYPSYRASWIRKKGVVAREFDTCKWKKDNRLILDLKAVFQENVL